MNIIEFDILSKDTFSVGISYRKTTREFEKAPGRCFPCNELVLGFVFFNIRWTKPLINFVD
jgi:hypothetical protein